MNYIQVFRFAGFFLFRHMWSDGVFSFLELLLGRSLLVTRIRGTQKLVHVSSRFSFGDTFEFLISLMDAARFGFGHRTIFAGRKTMSAMCARLQVHAFGFSGVRCSQRHAARSAALAAPCMRSRECEQIVG